MNLQIQRDGSQVFSNDEFAFSNNTSRGLDDVSDQFYIIFY